VAADDTLLSDRPRTADARSDRIALANGGHQIQRHHIDPRSGVKASAALWPNWATVAHTDRHEITSCFTTPQHDPPTPRHRETRAELIKAISFDTLGPADITRRGDATPGVPCGRSTSASSKGDARREIWLMGRNAGNRVLVLVKTIERNGGVLEDDWDSEHGRVRRCWIDLGESTG